ncbi:hypothetical protein [Flavobacterium sp. MK4S-17]|jgi:hypothetical protein|uniref:hypothetical protein n=1 Tax=Flavobacterium sp. MK4S-17 TaxID=2543737 RepID=UPI0013572128|nr:hypothetical protein [Flavobacterium sp. MK4S-17]
MKRFVFSILFVFTSTFMSAQAFGASGLKVTGNFASTKPVYQQWLKLNGRDVTMKFPQTPQGLNDAVQEVQRMLVKNELLITRPDIYKSVEADIDEKNPERLHKSIQDGKSRINLAWYSPDGSTLHLFLGKNSYEVNVLNAYKLN